MGLTLQDLEICCSLAREAREIIERIDAIQCMAERCTPVYSETPKGRDLSDKVADGAVEMLDFFEQRRDVAYSYLQHVRYVEAAIDSLTDSEERRVLRYWYVDGLVVEEIMVRMYVSRGTIYNRRTAGLQNLGIE